MRNFLLLLALSLQFFAAAPTFIPPQGTPGEVLALINAYRAENGLPALVENATLAYIAQAQADYLISQPMGTVGDVHEGPGGSRPKDRAYAAGYGGGEGISVSEIVKGGVDESPESAMAWWKTSPPHNNTMLTTFSTEFGAGAATDGNGRWWYVTDFGTRSGGAYAPNDPSSQSTPLAAFGYVTPVTKADPQPDGSIIHIVRSGQNLWTIADVYGVPLEQVMQLNGNNETIYPGDEVMVAPAGSAPTVAPTAEPSTTPIPWTPTPLVSPTLSPTAQLEQLAAAQTPVELAAQSNLSAEQQAQAANSTVYLVVGVALVSVVGVFAASFLIQKPQPPAPPPNDPFAPIE